MDSPLVVLHDYVGTLLPATDTRSPVSQVGSVFDFLFPFPEGPTYKKCSSLMFLIEVRWDSRLGVVCVEAGLKRIRKETIQDVGTFFDTLDNEISVFLSAVYPPSTEEPVPQGSFHPKETQLAKYIVPAFIVGFTFDPGQEELLVPEFATHLQYVCRGLWLAAPVIKFVTEKGQEPTAAERFRLLSIAHGTAEVLRYERRKKGDPPPVINFPRGLFSTRFCGDTIRQLRPQ